MRILIILISFPGFLWSQTSNGLFETVFRYKRSNTLFISTKDSSICYRIGGLYRIMSLSDSMCYEPSYPWHQKTLMSYHINDYSRILKIDTNRVNFDTWLNTHISKRTDSVTLTKFSFLVDTIRFKNVPDTLYAWVDLESVPPVNWITETLSLFNVFKGIPETATVKSIVYGQSEVSLKDLVLTGESKDFRKEIQGPINVDLTEQYVRYRKPWDN